MEYFKSGLKSVLGAPQPGNQPSGAETVERLIDRVQSSTLLEDRRDACRGLKALSRTYRVEVGAQGMDTLCQVLETDRSDGEIVGYALDTLCNITSTDVFEEEDRTQLGQEALSTVGGQFTEIFIKQPDNVSLVLGLMEEFDFHIRWPAVKLLTNMLTSRPKEIQDIILVSPMGVSKLMDLLGDSREVIRNDALLMLILLTKNNANIQKIVAFENAFDRLFDVIVEEGGADGGIVVEDCLLLMLNLLRNNTSNQNFFKEGSYIQKFAPMFELPADGSEDGWSAQKVSNSHCMLQVVRTLVSPSNPAQVTSSCQRIMKSCGLLQALCNILMASGVPADVLTETINTVAEVIRGNQQNQEMFSSVMAPSNPPRPAIVVLLMSMVNEKQPFILRCAVLYCFQCFLFKNESGQSQIAQTLLPSSSEHMSSLTTGQLLCGGLFSPDALSNWFSAVALSHSLVDNPAQKEQLLRVLLATTAGQPPVSLLQQCTLLLQQVPKVQSRLGLLMLLCSWLAHCPQAVQQFLSISSSIPFLTAQVSSSEHGDNEELVQGICAFLMGICIHFNDDSVASFTKEKLCQLIAKRVGLETFLDHLGEVSRHEMYSKAAKHPQLKTRQASELILDHEFCRLFKALEGLVIKAVTPKPQNDLVNGGSELSDSVLVMQYKDLIRDQDRRMQEMTEHLAALELEKTNAVSQAEELKALVQQLKDHNVLLRAQKLSEAASAPTEPVVHPTDAVLLNMDDIESGVTPKPSEGFALSAQLAQAEERAHLAEGRAAQAEARAAHFEQLARDAELRAATAEQQVMALQAEVSKVHHDQEDLLELLTDQDSRLNDYKSRLKALGQKIDDEEDEGDEEELVALTGEVDPM